MSVRKESRPMDIVRKPGAEETSDLGSSLGRSSTKPRPLPSSFSSSSFSTRRDAPQTVKKDPGQTPAAVRRERSLFGGAASPMLERRGSITQLVGDEIESEKKGAKLLQQYLLSTVLGKGQFGKVKHGIDIWSGRIVAVKTIKPPLQGRSRLESGGGMNLKQRIKMEIKALQMLKNHPNIVQLVEVIKKGEKTYLVLENLTGGTLDSRLTESAGKRVPEEVAQVYFAQIMKAIAFIHSKGVVHRDIKPQNIMFGCDDVLKLTDFGTAEIISPFDPNPILDTSVGTPMYQPPECSTGDFAAHAYAYDLWAAGTTLYQMVVGAMPFSGEKITSLWENLREARLAIPDWVSPELAHLLSGMLEKEHKDRLTTHEILRHPWFTLRFHQLNMQQPSPSVQPTTTPNKTPFQPPPFKRQGSEPVFGSPLLQSEGNNTTTTNNNNLNNTSTNYNTTPASLANTSINITSTTDPNASMVSVGGALDENPTLHSSLMMDRPNRARFASTATMRSTPLAPTTSRPFLSPSSGSRNRFESDEQFFELAAAPAGPNSSSSNNNIHKGLTPNNNNNNNLAAPASPASSSANNALSDNEPALIATQMSIASSTHTEAASETPARSQSIPMEPETPRGEDPLEDGFQTPPARTKIDLVVVTPGGTAKTMTLDSAQKPAPPAAPLFASPPHSNNPNNSNNTPTNMNTSQNLSGVLSSGKNNNNNTSMRDLQQQQQQQNTQNAAAATPSRSFNTSMGSIHQTSTGKKGVPTANSSQVLLFGAYRERKNKLNLDGLLDQCKIYLQANPHLAPHSVSTTFATPFMTSLNEVDTPVLGPSSPPTESPMLSNRNRNPFPSIADTDPIFDTQPIVMRNPPKGEEFPASPKPKPALLGLNSPRSLNSTFPGRASPLPPSALPSSALSSPPTQGPSSHHDGTNAPHAHSHLASPPQQQHYGSNAETSSTNSAQGAPVLHQFSDQRERAMSSSLPMSSALFPMAAANTSPIPMSSRARYNSVASPPVVISTGPVGTPPARPNSAQAASPQIQRRPRASVSSVVSSSTDDKNNNSNNNNGNNNDDTKADDAKADDADADSSAKHAAGIPPTTINDRPRNVINSSSSPAIEQATSQGDSEGGSAHGGQGGERASSGSNVATPPPAIKEGTGRESIIARRRALKDTPHRLSRSDLSINSSASGGPPSPLSRHGSMADEMIFPMTFTPPPTPPPASKPRRTTASDQHAPAVGAIVTPAVSSSDFPDTTETNDEAFSPQLMHHNDPHGSSSATVAATVAPVPAYKTSSSASDLHSSTDRGGALHISSSAEGFAQAESVTSRSSVTEPGSESTPQTSGTTTPAQSASTPSTSRKGKKDKDGKEKCLMS